MIQDVAMVVIYGLCAVLMMTPLLMAVGMVRAGFRESGRPARPPSRGRRPVTSGDER